MNKRRSEALFLSALILIGVVIRSAYIFVRNTMDGDASVLALMAKHISELKEFPAFLWCNHYTGSLTSYIAAALFGIFGVSWASYCCTVLIFSLVSMSLMIIVSRRSLDRAGFIPAAILSAIPPINALILSLFMGGIQAENMLFGSLLLFLMAVYIKAEKLSGYIYAILGFTSGIALWTSPGTFPFILTLLTVFLIKEKKLFFSRLPVFAAFFAIGLLPMIAYNITHHGATFIRFGGRILNVDRGALGHGNPVKIFTDGLLWRLSTFTVSLIRVPVLLSSLMGIANAVLFISGFILALRNSFAGFLKTGKIDIMDISVIFVLWFTVFYSLLVGEDHVRYVFPLYVVAPLFIGKLMSGIRFKSKIIYIIILAAIFLYNAGTVRAAFLNIRENNFPKLIKWLEAKDIHYGYSDHETAYTIVFQSKEKILVSPTLYHPTFSERRPQYTSRVRDSDRAAFIIYTTDYPLAGQVMEEGLKKLGVGFKKDIVGEFIVYYDPSRKVRPEEIAGIPGMNRVRNR